MPKIGFMFGAGAEISYGLPTGGDFALNIFRQDVTESKNDFRSQRDSIDGTSLYAQWLPEGYENKSIPEHYRSVQANRIIAPDSAVAAPVLH